MISDIEHIFICHLCVIFLGEMSAQALCPPDMLLSTKYTKDFEGLVLKYVKYLINTFSKILTYSKYCHFNIGLK